MSTDEYVPSDPPTREDWEHLAARAEVNKRRGRRGVALGVISLVLAVAVLVAGAVIYLSQRDVPEVLDNQTTALTKINEIVRGLEQADRQRTSESRNNALAFAVIVENIAAGFGTPPAPDPARLRAVQGLCDTARAFRASVGDMNPPPCPTP